MPLKPGVAEVAEHIVVLANPTSGRGRGSAAAAAAVARLRELGAEVHAFAGTSVADTRRLAAQAVADRPRALVVVGGDGTLSSVLDEVVDAGIPIALVPAGTGNDLARALGLPYEASAVAGAAELALSGVPRRIDVGVVETDGGARHFLTVAALGFDARVSERTNRLRWPRGRVRYYFALLVELARLHPVLFSIGVDGAPRQHRPGTLVAIGNTASYGGGMPVCPAADPSDGLLQITHVAPLGRAKLIRLFPLLLGGRHVDRSEVTSSTASAIEVVSPGLVVYADGERLGDGAVRISLRPGALTVLVPDTTMTPGRQA
ncbi:diacylglycerol kinase [Microterricola gilva]|uniref:Diacylglycerol kinase n=1 Tax=Microterricola gilva TaxID=393267 RepID=A0A4Q8AMC4_9MICO|nr:YegS/Rv2252/BmrU family lipid kinase [Microterricola gilva]RZU65648.1 diacylglycerol kinase [Microterricola gilva]